MIDQPIVRISDVMTPAVRTIGGMATVQEAIDLMRDVGVSSLVVERRDRDDEFGLLTITDIAGFVIAEGRAPDRVNIYEIMTKPVVSVALNMDIKYAVRLLMRYRLTRALVVNEGRKPVGIVTLRDVVLRRHGEPAPHPKRRKEDLIGDTGDKAGKAGEAKT
jgi:signal-transduction protein with cAMP-binding, CBS, and nucleotidyltransferase domain